VTDKDRIQQMVRRVVYRTLGLQAPIRPSPARPLVTEKEINSLPYGASCPVPEGALVTPLARQIAMDRKIELVESQPGLTSRALHSMTSGIAVPKGSLASAGTALKGTIALAADHGGYQLKEALKSTLSGMGYEIVDCGTDSTRSVDYPDYAFAAAQLVARGRAWRAIVIDGAGIGSCMAANKVPGVRASMCYDQATAVNSREHNDANVLTLGAGLIGENLARQIVKTWLETPFAGGRHARRVDKIMDIQRRFSR
jgi:ribose 5-phosphate isomerase B